MTQIFVVLIKQVVIKQGVSKRPSVLALLPVVCLQWKHCTSLIIVYLLFLHHRYPCGIVPVSLFHSLLITKLSIRTNV